jgi:rare lipoprotein A (peptidoglycan hydrolase)
LILQKVNNIWANAAKNLYLFHNMLFRRLFLFAILISITALVHAQDAKDSVRLSTGTIITKVDTGIASWYGHKWQGRMTASGELFHPDSMTAAHKTLPFGTIVEVRNLKNDSVVHVVITDRLPKSSTRSIDLSPAAAKRLNFYSAGLTKVTIRPVGKRAIRKAKK